MTTIDELDELEFVNWDAADDGIGSLDTHALVSEGVPASAPLAHVGVTMDLAFNDATGDDWSFWALQHFDTTQAVPDAQLSNAASQDETSAAQLPWETHEDVTPERTDSIARPAENLPPPNSTPKVGARFSREALRILKNWAATHSRHPYPTDEEREHLQRLTGLNKTQITNWLSNARRRGKIQPRRSASPRVGPGYATAIDIPRRPGTPSLFEDMNPLQRWANSPPENEPAFATDIARAVASDSPRGSSTSGPSNSYLSGYSDDGSGVSLCNKSHASNLSNSRESSASYASSRQSRGSFGSLPSFTHGRGRRRRRKVLAPDADEPVRQPLRPYQCTFCTKTFRTKHDWQRHEKSLHLSLERWVCAPDGATAVHSDTGLVTCVFCGEVETNHDRLDAHGFSSCAEKSVEQRTFYRKDHLRQHLKLVHDVQFSKWPMDQWKAAYPPIRSRCGFCDMVMDSWASRADHLAEHFNTGQTMADWRGDWGFELPVLKMVENALPPDRAQDEKGSPAPDIAGSDPKPTPNSGYDLIQTKLNCWLTSFTRQNGRQPTDSEMQREACRIVLAAEALSEKSSGASSSRLRDLFMSNDEVRLAAMATPRRGLSDHTVDTLRIKGKGDIFESCAAEAQLHKLVEARSLLGFTAMDHELQADACRVIGTMEERAGSRCEPVADWLRRLVNSSSKWLVGFRNRAALPRTEDLADEHEHESSGDVVSTHNTAHSYSRLERELSQHLQVQRSLGLEPTDDDLQRQARLIIYELDDPWNQTAADDPTWLGSFRRSHPAEGHSATQGCYDGNPQFSGPWEDITTTRAFAPKPATAATDHCPQTSSQHRNKYPQLANVLCSRELENGLADFVQRRQLQHDGSGFPGDDELRERARRILGVQETPCDDGALLEKFKAAVRAGGGGASSTTSTCSTAMTGGGGGFVMDFPTHPGLGLGLVGLGAAEMDLDDPTLLQAVDAEPTGCTNLTDDDWDLDVDGILPDL